MSALDVSVQAQVINLLSNCRMSSTDVHLHRPRPVGGTPHLRPRGRHVPRQDRGGSVTRPRSTNTRPTHTPGVAVGGSPFRTRSAARAPAHRLAGRCPESGESSVGLPFPRTRCWKGQDICAEQEPPCCRSGRGWRTGVSLPAGPRHPRQRRAYRRWIDLRDMPGMHCHCEEYPRSCPMTRKLWVIRQPTGEFGVCAGGNL